MTVVSKQEENTNKKKEHTNVHSFQRRGGKNKPKLKKKKRERDVDTQSCIGVELWEKKKQKIPSSSPRSLLVIPSAFFFVLLPGVTLRRKIKGKKENSKTTGLQKIQKRDTTQ